MSALQIRAEPSTVRGMEHAFDTLAFAESLEQGGFTRQQAQVLAREQAKLIDERRT